MDRSNTSDTTKEQNCIPFQIDEEKKTKWSLIGTWVAIGISLILAAFSVYATYCVDPSEKNLRKIQSQLEKVIEKMPDDENESAIQDNVNIENCLESTESKLQEKNTISDEATDKNTPELYVALCLGKLA